MPAKKTRKKATPKRKATASKKTAVRGATAFNKQVRKVALAGIGAVSLARQEVDGFVKKLIQRGQLAEKEGRSLLKDIEKKWTKVRKSGKTKGKKAKARLELNLDGRIDKILNRLHLPTKKDIDKLNKRIEQLTIKLEKLTR